MREVTPPYEEEAHKERTFDFSVLLPVYNTEQYLSRALDSLKAQNYEKLEVVVVNDGSPKKEECRKIVHQYSSSLHIKYIEHEKNKGSHEARLTGVNEANGKYILFLDSDDELAEGALKELSIYIKEDFDYIQFPSKTVGGEKENKEFWEAFTFSRFTNINDLLEDKLPHNLCLKCFKSSLLKPIYDALPHFFCYYAEDYFLAAIIEYYAKKRAFTDKAFYIYHLEIGVTGEKTYSNSEKIKKILLSLAGIEKHLSEFFLKNNEKILAKKVHEYIYIQHLDLLIRAKNSEIKRLIMEDISFKTARKKVSFAFRFTKTVYKKCKAFAKSLLPAPVWRTLKRIVKCYQKKN